jgi:DNA-binding transcriptional LysR family regulator
MPHSRIRRYLKHGTLPQLAAFEAIARLGSFTRAAEELHMAQSTVSGHMRKLGESVGVPLFRMDGRRVCLTDAGRRLQAGCQELFSLLGDIEENLAGLRGAAGGRGYSAKPVAGGQPGMLAGAT